MLTHDVLETQTAIELPAREMLGVFNFANVATYQGNLNAQLGALNINMLQANSSGVLVLQG